MNTIQNPTIEEDFMTPEWREERADMIAAIEAEADPVLVPV